MTQLDELARLRKQFDANDARAIKKLVDAYGASYGRVELQIQALLEYMEGMDVVTRAAIQKSAAYKNLIRTVNDELEEYASDMKTWTKDAANESARNGLTAERVLIIAGLAQALGVDTKDVPGELVRQAAPDALDFLSDYLNPRGALFGKIETLSSFHSVQIADGILERVGLGQNPKVIAEWITDAYGYPLVDSMRQMRTVQLYSYRQANNEIQKENAELLEGMVWVAELDDLTCLSCVAQHGEVFPVGSICNDHHNGRCALVPWVKGMENPISETGKSWFESKPEAEQQKMMGPEKYEAYKDGKFEFGQLTKEYDNDVFGIMKTESTLKDLIGG